MTTENKQFTENDRIFYSDGYQLAQSAFQQGFSNDSLFSAIESLYAAIDGLNDSIISLAKRQNSEVACFKGCHWCYHQAVFANSYELHFLSEKIKKNFNSDELSALISRIETKHANTSKLSEEEILKYKAPCPLLKDNACSVYAARPMACRIYLSTKLDTCLEFYHHPENETNYPALIDFPLRAGQMMNEGFSAALKKNGIETAVFRMEEGLRTALQNNQPIF
ncbi:MAG TPA: YkgJ family cysteine cluster protein [Prolixibacteraceae bacterium]|nr:YkgJ family cysteine cluster protein [Prolixibacteraceae bacterium]